MPSHNDLVLQAKKEQLARLRQSQTLSKQLIATIVRFNRHNSTQSDLVEKITMIHSLNTQIDTQLNEDFATNFQQLKVYQELLLKLIDKLYKIMYSRNLVGDLQARAELIDQDLRILETTLKLVRNRTD
jgi:hypothetical protein